ncbi:hypothetical protein Naga_100335g2 [Nannochloropsis gaditana]|uniref:Derlin n=1 Tax=Nannochloropsis gaditana TaxID=72520 RepID=W7TAL9_9STRA|nr:hypothetical protein Naga_100335g2 [Nannochloropsis gaditana]
MASSAPPSGGTAPSPIASVKEWYHNWCASTPFITRSTLHLLLALYALSWVVDLTAYLANIPYMSIYKLQLWRPFLSPFYTEGLLSVLFLCLSLGGMATTLEQAKGSTSFLCLMAAISFLTNFLFLLICLLLSVLQPSALYLSAGSFWIVVLGLLTVDCLASNLPTRQLFGLPCQIPSLYFPLLLFLLFSLFAGPRLDLGLAVGVGYLVGWGYLDVLLPPLACLTRWEEGRIGSWLGSRTGSSGSSASRPPANARELAEARAAKFGGPNGPTASSSNENEEETATLLRR